MKKSDTIWSDNGIWTKFQTRSATQLQTPIARSATHSSPLRRITSIILIALTVFTVPVVVQATSGGLPQSSAAQPYVAAINTGFYHTCAIIGSTGIKCWGANGSRQLSDGTTVDKSSPVFVTPSITDASQVSGGWIHTCALRLTGALVCWGGNGSGQLATGDFLGNTSQVTISGLSGPIKSIAATDEGNCVLLISGGVQCWGFSANLGNGATTNSSTPSFVTGLTSGVEQISGNSYSTCALMTSTGVKCWGTNDSGRIGDGTKINRLTPVDVSNLTAGASAVSVGKNHACALMIDKSVQCWGNNTQGQLGVGDTTERLVPTVVSALGNTVEMITTGGFMSCALLTDTTVKCWGSNSRGDLGDNTTTNRSSPVLVSGLSGVRTLTTTGGFGGDHTCALLLDGNVKCWGSNGSGQIGDGTIINKLVPTAIRTSASDASALAGVSVATTVAPTTTTVAPTTTTVAPTTTTVAPVLEIVVSAPVTTVAIGQSSVSTIGTPRVTVPSVAVKPITSTIPSAATTSTTMADGSSGVSTRPVPSVQAVSAGEVGVKVGNKTEKATIERVNNQYVVSVGQLKATIAPMTATGGVAGLDKDGNIRLLGGSKIKITMNGFKPGSILEAWLFSTPLMLGTAKVGADGSVTGTFTVPATIDNGSHRIALIAQTKDGKPTTFTIGVMAGEWDSGPNVTLWLIVLPIVLAVGGALAIPATRRRRKSSFSN